MATKHLDGKVALVTGGAGGMGSWISRIFAEQGAKVVVADTGATSRGAWASTRRASKPS